MQRAYKFNTNYSKQALWDKFMEALLRHKYSLRLLWIVKVHQQEIVDIL